MRLAVCGVCLALAWSAPAPPRGATLFEGARLIVDARKPPIEDGAILVQDGRIAAVGPRASVRAPSSAARVSLAGKTVMPAIVDAHVHLGYQAGTSFDAANYTRETLLDQLNAYQRAGVAAVLSLGTDPPDLADRIRAEQLAGRLGGALFLFAGRGIAVPNAGPGTPGNSKASANGARLKTRRGATSGAEISRKVDVVKIWVDDRTARAQKLAPPLYRAVIDEAHRCGARVVAHIFYLDDAKALARAGVDAFAHLVRDREADDELVALMKSITSRRCRTSRSARTACTPSRRRGWTIRCCATWRRPP